jgi:hypothetical protein
LLPGESSVFVHADRLKDVPQYVASRSPTVAPNSGGLSPDSRAWETRFGRRAPAITNDWRQLMTAQ